MFGIGTGELLMILIIAMMVVGPEKMVQLSKQFGQLVAKFRQQTEGVTQEFREALSLDLDDEEEKTAAPQLPSGQAQASAPDDSPAALASASASEPQLEAAPASAAPTPAEDQITADELLRAELEAAMFDGEVEVVAPDGSEAEAPRSAAPDEVVELDIAQLVPEDVDVQPTLIEEPVLVADEPASADAAEPLQDKA